MLKGEPYYGSKENDVATGPSGPVGGGGHIPFFGDMLKKAADAAKKQATGKTEAEEASESLNLSDAAKGLAVTKDEKMLQAMKAELAKLDPDSEGFMEEATGKLIDSVIDQEYGESFKKKPGYENLQEKLVETVLNSEAYDEVEDFFKLLLLAEEVEYESQHEDEDAEEDDESLHDSEEEPYEEDE